MISRNVVGLFLLLLVLVQCRDDFNVLPFFHAVTGEVVILGIDKVRLNGRVTNLAGENVDQYGFILNTTDSEPNLDSYDQIFSLHSLPSDGAFQYEVDGLSLNFNYTVRSYVRQGERVSLGDSRFFDLRNNVSVSIADSAIIANDTAILTGLITINVSEEVDDHGITYAKHREPVYQVDSTYMRGPTRNTGPFTYFSTNLDLNSTYYARSFFRVGDSVNYSSVFSFATLDGWKLLDTIQKFVDDPVGAGGGNLAFVGIGCAENLCDEENAVGFNSIWSVNPNSSPGARITPVETNVNGPGRKEAISFFIGDRFYFGMGLIPGSGRKLFDFYAYDPLTSKWEGMDSVPFHSRGSVSFSLDSVGYVGTGYDDETKLELQQFWQFNPRASPMWSQIEHMSLPVFFEGSQSQKGRSNAFSFVLNNEVYVGGGEVLGRKVNDLWKLNQNKLTWELVDQKTPFEGRSNAVTFSIDAIGRAYLGFGYDGAVSLNDLWEFDGFSWVERQSFPLSSLPSTIRAEKISFGFSIGNHGYVGGGNTDNHTLDIWEYQHIIE